MAQATKSRASKASQKVDIDWRAMIVEAMEAPGHLGNTYCRFYDYSFMNQLRLMMQGVMEPAATYRRWSELGFQVQKGMKAKAVLAPIMVNKELTKDGVTQYNSDGKPMKQQVLVGFKDSNSVFGFSDTDGDELPEIAYPAWDLDSALESLGVQRVRFDDVDGNTQGYSYEDKGQKKLAINPAAAHPHKVVFHELAHLVLGHCKDAKAYAGDTKHRGMCEFEAEMVAYLVSKELDLIDWDASESRAYLQHWLEVSTGGPEIDDDGEADYPEVTDKVISGMFSAVNKILTAGRKSNSEGAA